MALKSKSILKYGVVAAGAAGQSLIARLPNKATEVGPVVGISYSVASRIANALRAGQATPDPSELNRTPTVLLHAPADQAAGLVKLLETGAIEWEGKGLIVCDCEVPAAALAGLVARGARIVWIREFGIAGYIAVRGVHAVAQRLVRELKLRAVEIPAGLEGAFDAALTLAGGAFTPLIDAVASLLRESGVRESEAPRLATSLFINTASAYAHSGKQSWDWYTHGPGAGDLNAQIRGAQPQLGGILRDLALLGFGVFEKHQEIAGELDAPPGGGEAQSRRVTTVAPHPPASIGASR